MLKKRILSVVKFAIIESDVRGTNRFLFILRAIAKSRRNFVDIMQISSSITARNISRKTYRMINLKSER